MTSKNWTEFRALKLNDDLRRDSSARHEGGMPKIIMLDNEQYFHQRNLENSMYFWHSAEQHGGMHRYMYKVRQSIGSGWSSWQPRYDPATMKLPSEMYKREFLQKAEECLKASSRQQSFAIRHSDCSSPLKPLPKDRW